MIVFRRAGETQEQALERARKEELELSKKYQEPKKSTDNIARFDLVIIIWEDMGSETCNIQVNKTYCTEEPDKQQAFNTLGKICENFGVELKKNRVITIILERPLDGEIWQYNNYSDGLWHYHGEVRGYA